MAGEHAGASLIEMLWDQLDAQYNRLKELHEEYGDSSALRTDYKEQSGKVQGLCFAVGTILYPYDSPKDRIEKVRAELPQRWADAYGEDEEENEQ